MTKPKIVYKVVRFRDNLYTSLYPYDNHNKLWKIYNIGKITCSNLGYLFCFQDLEYAKRAYPDRIIFECETDKIIKTRKTTIPRPGCYNLKDLERYWNNKRISRSYFTDLPKGTVFCKSVTPIKVCDI